MFSTDFRLDFQKNTIFDAEWAEKLDFRRRMSWKTRLSTPNELKNTIFDAEWAEKRDFRDRMIKQIILSRPNDSKNQMFEAEWANVWWQKDY